MIEAPEFDVKSTLNARQKEAKVVAEFVNDGADAKLREKIEEEIKLFPKVLEESVHDFYEILERDTEELGQVEEMDDDFVLQAMQVSPHQRGGVAL